MRIIDSIEKAIRGTSFCKSCGLRIKKGFPRIRFDDDKFACHKCFERTIENHKDFLNDYLTNAIPKFKKDMEEIKKGLTKELIIDKLENGE
jgi:hypothetical protein